MQGREGWNFFRFYGLSLFNVHYFYFDRERCSYSLLYRRNVHMKIKEILEHPDENYIVVDCKVRKKDAGEFENAMQELPNKMLLCGYRDYDAFCDRMADMFEEKERLRSQEKTRDERDHQANSSCREERNCSDGIGTCESNRGTEHQL